VVNIRELNGRDYPAYHDLMIQVHRLHVENRPDCYVDCDPFTEAGFQAMLNDENVHAYAAELDGRVIGLAMVRMKQTPPGTPMQPRRVAFIDDVVVDEHHRGRGVGTALLNHLRACVKGWNADSLELMVWGFNTAAMRMYEKAGFTLRSAILECKE